MIQESFFAFFRGCGRGFMTFARWRARRIRAISFSKRGRLRRPGSVCSAIFFRYSYSASGEVGTPSLKTINLKSPASFSVPSLGRDGRPPTRNGFVDPLCCLTESRPALAAFSKASSPRSADWNPISTFQTNKRIEASAVRLLAESSFNRGPANFNANPKLRLTLSDLLNEIFPFV